ncbi:hypothetical protein JCM1840_002359 [Sporobolomyces johnsonii]
MAKRKAPQSTTKSAPPSAASAAAKPAPPAKRARFDNPPPANKSKPAVKSKAAAAKPAAEATTPPAPVRFVVSAGSYERLLYGLECTFHPAPPSPSTSNLPYELSVNPIFSFPAHLSSLRSVAASALPSPGTGSERKVGGKYLVSGGTDEVIKVWDLNRRKEVGSLEGDASGTITCLRFVPQRNMLLAASSDSTISLYRVRDWALLRALKGHKGRVNAVDAHPDGRVALSVGVDRMLRMWDLVAGKSVATMKLGTEGDAVRWNTNGTKFAVICGTNLTVYGIDMSIHHSLSAPSRFHDVRFCYFPLDAQDPAQREYLFVACEDGKVRIFDVSEPTPVTVDEGTDLSELDLPKMDPVATLDGHSNRVKMMDLLEVALPASPDAPASSSEPATTIVLTTVSSDGKIHLYDLARLARPATATPKGKGKGKAAAAPIPTAAPRGIEPSASYDTDKTRLTCVCAIGLVEKKRKGDGTDGDAAEGGEESDEESDDDEDGSEEDDDDGSELEGEEDEFEGIEEFDDEEEDEGEEE